MSDEKTEDSTETPLMHGLGMNDKVWVVNGRGKKYDVAGEVVRRPWAGSLPFYLVRFPGLVSLYSFEERHLRVVE